MLLIRGKRSQPFVLLAAALAALCPFGSANAQPAAKKASPESTACIEDYEGVQSLREGGKLRSAREKAIACSRDVCPKVIASECATWLGQLSESMPSVVLAATGPNGEDLTAVNVYFDTELLATELTSLAVPVDPGKYSVRFESKEHGSREAGVVIREGEKNRKISVSFEAKKDETPPPPKVELELERPVPVATWALIGVGGAAVVAGAIFESLGLVQKSELDECKPSCAPDDVDAMMRNFVIGDAALVTGGVVLGAALIVFLTRPSVPGEKPIEKKAQAAPELVVAPGLGGGAAVATWRF